MFINGIDIVTLGGKLLKKDIQVAEYSSERTWLKDSLLPLKTSEKWSYRKVRLEILVTGTDRNDVFMKISNVVSKVNECDIKFKDLDLFHHLFLVTKNIEKTIVKTKYRLNVEFEGYAYKDYVIEVVDHIANKTINVSGNIQTPCILKVTVPVDTISLTLQGFGEDIIIKNLKANTPAIIDGEACTVLENNINKFGDTDIWEYPKLKPGANTITISTANSTVNISYRPRWI